MCTLIYIYILSELSVPLLAVLILLLHCCYNTTDNNINITVISAEAADAITSITSTALLQLIVTLLAKIHSAMTHLFS